MENELDIVCEDCGVTFVHMPRGDRPTAAPTRCSLCRSQFARSKATTDKPQYTGDPNEYRSPMACTFPEPRRSGRDGRGLVERTGGVGSEGGRARHRAARPMFTAVCSKCGSTAHVPFQPSKFQEVLCRTCYQEKRGVRSAPPGES
jgi:CxxC-x17-CxxC domain-containing protein